MVFGAPRDAAPAHVPADARSESGFRLPFSCALALIIAAVPMLVLGVYVPQPLHELLKQAAAALGR
jgi:hypothetical protein